MIGFLGHYIVRFRQEVIGWGDIFDMVVQGYFVNISITMRCWAAIALLIISFRADGHIYDFRGATLPHILAIIDITASSFTWCRRVSFQVFRYASLFHYFQRFRRLPGHTCIWLAAPPLPMSFHRSYRLLCFARSARAPPAWSPRQLASSARPPIKAYTPRYKARTLSALWITKTSPHYHNLPS